MHCAGDFTFSPRSSHSSSLNIEDGIFTPQRPPRSRSSSPLSHERQKNTAQWLKRSQQNGSAPQADHQQPGKPDEPQDGTMLKSTPENPLTLKLAQEASKTLSSNRQAARTFQLLLDSCSSEHGQELSMFHPMKGKRAAAVAKSTVTCCAKENAWHPSAMQCSQDESEMSASSKLHHVTEGSGHAARGRGRRSTPGLWATLGCCPPR